MAFCFGNYLKQLNFIFREQIFNAQHVLCESLLISLELIAAILFEFFISHKLLEKIILKIKFKNHKMSSFPETEEFMDETPMIKWNEVSCCRC